jgi:hypothetical protein
MYFWVWETSGRAALRLEATESAGRDEGAALELSRAGPGLGAVGRAVETFWVAEAFCAMLTAGADWPVVVPVVVCASAVTQGSASVVNRTQARVARQTVI